MKTGARRVTHWQDASNLLLACWLFVSPWLLDYSEVQLPAWNSFVVAVIVAVFAAAAMLKSTKWEEWINIVVGLWLIASPWFLDYSAAVTATWNHVVIGVLFVVLSGWKLNAVSVMSAEKGMTSFNGKALDTDKDAVTNAAEVMETMVSPPPRRVVESPTPRPELTTNAGTISAIGSGMSIVGTIDCNGPAEIFGRIEGEVRASDLLICEGAQIEGNILAQEVTICGRVKGTIRAVRVKLQGGGAVEGDIFHRSLSIDENSLFEGLSRRVENPMDAPPSIAAKSTRKRNGQTSAPPQVASIDADSQGG